MIQRLEVVLSGAELLLLQAAEAIVLVHEVTDGAEAVKVDAGRVVRKIDALQSRATVLLDSIEPLVQVAAGTDVELVRSLVGTLERLQPLLAALTTVDAQVPAQGAELISRSLPLVQELGPALGPLVEQARAILPDLHEILSVITRLEPVVTDVETRIAGLPGAGRLLKRGERAIEDATSGDS